MEIIRDKLLVIASEETNRQIKEALWDFSGIELSSAADWDSAFPQVHTKETALVLLETPQAGVDLSQVLETFSKRRIFKTPPLLIISHSNGSEIPSAVLFDRYPDVLIDWIAGPVRPEFLRAKVRIFLELHQNRTAVSQSINELDRVYEKIIVQHEAAFKEENFIKDVLNLASSAASQTELPLKKVRAGVYTLSQSRDLSPALRSGVTRIQNAVKQLGKITRRIHEFSNRSERQFPEMHDSKGQARPFRVLYAVNSSEEFQIFRHYLNSMVKNQCFQAASLTQAMKIIAENPLDILFIDHLLSDATGLELLSRLSRLGHDTPMVFTTDRANARAGAESLTKGALTFYVKEEISARNIRSIIFQALDKSQMVRDMAHARDRIVVISRRDHLTRLYNRRSFEKVLEAETAKALRYEQALAVLLIGFENLKALAETHGPDAPDLTITACAAIIQSKVRDVDQVCRFSQEEFGLILPGTGTEGAGIMARRLLDHLSGKRFKYGDRGPAQLTLHMGIASYAGEPALKKRQTRPNLQEDLVRLASQALDKARRQEDDTIQLLRITEIGSHD